MRSIRLFFATPLGHLVAFATLPTLTLLGLRTLLRTWVGENALALTIPWQEMAIPLAFVLFSLLQRFALSGPIELTLSPARACGAGLLILAALASYYGRSNFSPDVALVLFCTLGGWRSSPPC